MSQTYAAAELVAAPQFWQALTKQAQDLLAVHAASPAEVHYLADIRRWMMIQMAIGLFLEHRRDPTSPSLSPKSLFTALEGARIASRNTVQVFLREMTRVQFTEHPAPTTIRQRAPKVSEKSEALMRVYLDIHLRALDTIDSGTRAAFFAKTPAFLSYLQPEFAKRVCRSPAWYDPPEAIKCFINSVSGSSILHDMVLATRTLRADAADKIWIGPVSTADLARRHHVSPAHIARLLSRAATLNGVGWSRPARRGDCWLSAQLGADYLNWQAEKLSVLSHAHQVAFEVFHNHPNNSRSNAALE